MPKKGKEPAGLRRWRLAHRAKRKARRSARSSGGSSTPGFAATYQHGKTALQILSPVTDAGLSVLEGGSTKGALDNLQARFTVSGNRTPWLKGVDWLSNSALVLKQGPVQAIRLLSCSMLLRLARLQCPGSLSPALLDNDLDPRDTHADFMATTSGFDPQAGGFSTHGKLRTYLGLKYGGKAVRWAAGAIPAAGRPIKKALNMLGLTL